VSLVDTPRGRWIRMRMGILCGLLAFGLGLVVSAGWDLMIKDGEAWRELADQQRQRRVHIVPKRGTVYDRNGSAVAVSVEVPSVSLDAIELLRGVAPQQLPVVARDGANRIAQVLAIDPAVVEKKILAKRRFAWLKRQISAKEADDIRALSSPKVQGDRVVRGLVVEGEGRRYYPRRELAGPLLGFVAPDGEGKDGLEFGMNNELRGHIEQLRGLRDRAGRLLFADGVQDEQALAGHNVYLSIDQGIQYVAERELASAARTFEAGGGSVIVIEPYTGEVLAMASWPGYNPNDYTLSEAEQRRDRGLTDAFEPGSTTKIFTIASGLAAGVISPTQKLYCEKGFMPVDNVVIRDTHPAGWLSISQVLAVSSNICSAKIGLSLGGDKLYEGLRRFGFGQATGLPLPGESEGTLRPRGRPWVQVETAAASFGQGISATNLQLAMATAAIANGGDLMEPILIKKVTTATGELVREATPRVRRRVVPRHIALAMAEMLVAVTEGEATGVEAAISGYQVAGKTATAQKTDPATGRYSLDDYIASFVGFVPAKKPVVAIAVMVDEPMVEHAGGAVAAPIFRRVGQAALEYVGLTPKGSQPVDVAELARKPDPAAAAYALLRQADGKKPPVQEAGKTGPVASGKVRVPDMTGWPVREAVRRAIELGIAPRVQGTGLLATQTPPPGDVVEKGADVLLVFEPAS
jgi:cell division protein FtsI (penicillin-binding protein 3)